MNTLQKLIEKYPDHEWSFERLSKNPSITPEFIEKHIDLSWDWGSDGISKNKSITLDFIEKYIDKQWYWGRYGLSSNPNITPEFIDSYLDKPWEWGKKVFLVTRVSLYHLLINILTNHGNGGKKAFQAIHL